jgi:long-subunit acyl-CoA synthetase (AMP-forming)
LNILNSSFPNSKLVLGVEASIAIGGECWFAASDAMRGALVQHFKWIGPTGLCAQVPRIWEKFHENIAPQLKSATGIKRILIDWSMKQVSILTHIFIQLNDS